MGEGGSLSERSIQPRPSIFAPINGQDQVSPPGTSERPAKKRGRPSKLEHEQRVREAEARGEVYPRPKKPKTPRPSLEGAVASEEYGAGGAAPMAVMFAPDKTGLSVASPSTGKKKKASEKESMEDPVETPIEAPVESPTATSDQLQAERGQAPRSTIPETQISEFGERESLLVEMRKHAEQSEHLDTSMQETEGHRKGAEMSQSTETVQGTYGSAPSNPFSGYS